MATEPKTAAQRRIDELKDQLSSVGQRLGEPESHDAAEMALRSIEEAIRLVQEQDREPSTFRYRVVSTGVGKVGDEDAMAEDLTDAKITASEARTDTKFARLDGRLDVMTRSLDLLNAGLAAQRSEASSNRNFLAGTMIASILALAGLIYAMLSYGAGNFYNGTVLRDAVKAEVNDRMVPATSTTAPAQKSP